MQTTTLRVRIWLIEYYTVAGDVRFCWVPGMSPDDAQHLMRSYRSDMSGRSIDMDEVIQITEHRSVVPLRECNQRNVRRLV